MYVPGAATAAANAVTSQSNWLNSTITAIQQNASSAGILGALQNSGDGSISSFLGINSGAANNFATIATSSVSSASSFYAQIAAQNDQQQQLKKLQDAVTSLNQAQNMVQPQNTLDPVIYLSDGTTIDTNNNIMTMPDGTQYDTTTGAKYVDPASIMQLANGAYLDTTNNVMTMPDGTRIDTVTGLTISTSA